MLSVEEEACSDKQKEGLEEQDKGESVSAKGHSSGIPLTVVLNSLASSVVQKLQQKKAVASSKKESSGKGSSKEEGKGDEEDADPFEDEEVDAMIDEMVAKTLENLVGMKMPSPRDSHQDDSEQQLSSAASAQHGEEPRGDGETERGGADASREGELGRPSEPQGRYCMQ